ncbi:UbiA family prenyltransferase [Planctomonas psychrotolerans]|uniref:UbiA family prenyltransferase n=1 Tax=Planctomonas psychrotolerans TaxID=2528712 RepID=UPI00123963D1|nr:UbiA family prenyltransferase [Planctomonas psychrotolerans]
MTGSAARVRALAASSHPGPVAVVTALGIVLSLALDFDAARVTAVALATVLGQLSVGFSNDWLDAGRDAVVGRTDKPVARGEVASSTVRNAAFVALAAAAVVSFLLGPAAGVTHLVALAGAWGYNAWLKNTAISVLPFMVSFGIYPLFVTFSAADPTWAAPWVIAVGALLGVAIHFTNVLPDLDDDLRTGIRGTAHRLGTVPAGLSAFGTLLAASVLVTYGPMLADARPPTGLHIAGLLLNAAIAGVGIVLVLTRPPRRLLFQLIAASGLLTVVMLAMSGTRLIA